MSSKDLFSNVNVVEAIVPGTYLNGSDPTPVTIDTKGYESCLLVLTTGTVTDAQTLNVQDSADDDSYDDVVSGDVVGGSSKLTAFETIAAGDDDTVKALGYIGNKRYLQVACSGAGETGAVFGIVAILGHAQYRPATT